VQASDVVDGLAYTLMVGEKAVPRGGNILAEDDMGYTSGFAGTVSGGNFNTVRFTQSTLLPIRDDQLPAGVQTGGAFGSPHFGTWNALMADGSVQNLNYNLAPLIFSALGTMRGREILTDADLNP
jgi:hypothetical protein